VLVVVTAVRRVPVTVVDVVHVVAVRDGDVPTALTVHMIAVIGMLGVTADLAFVEVALVFAMQVPVVHVVDMVAVRHRDMSTTRTVHVVVAGVRSVCCGHRTAFFPRMNGRAESITTD
jgi:hypothetical protein